MVLADDPQVESLFHDQQLGPFGLEHSGHGHTGPGTDDLCDFIRGHFGPQKLGVLFFFLTRYVFMFELLSEFPTLLVEFKEFLVVGLVDGKPRGLLVLDPVF